MGEMWRRIQYLWQRGRIQRELEEEMAAHRAEMGDPRAFGSTLKLREEANDAWGFRWLEQFQQDLHYAARNLSRSPGFTLTAVAVLGLGIGLNVTAFGFLNTAMFRPLPGIENPHTLMRLTRRSPQASSSDVSYPAYEFYRRNNSVFSSMLATSGSELTYQDNERWRTQLVTRNFFAELGAGPAYGRLDAREPGDVVLSTAFFERRFGHDVSIIGKPILLNRKAARVVGVVGAGFAGLDPEGADVYGLLEDHPHFFEASKLLSSTEMQPLHLYGRLAAGTSPEAAQEAMRPVVNAWREASPAEVWKDEYLLVTPGAYAMQTQSRDKILVPLLIASSLLLLVLATACANLGNLLLARSVSRERELAIRTAVGANRGRIVRQLMTESAALALLGAGAGLALSMVATTVLVRLLEWPSFVDATPDWRVVGFALGAGLLASVFFGLAPALQATRRDAKRAARLRLTLVGLQAAASCILLIVSGLLLRGLNKVVSEEPGFVYAQSAVIDPDLHGVGREGAAARLYFQDLQSRLAQLNGVEATAIATVPPLGRRTISLRHAAGSLLMNHISPEYFATMQIPLLRGRNFQVGDRDVTILGERAANRLWPNQDPIGQEFIPSPGEGRWTVVGVAANAPITSPGDSEAMELYRPIEDAHLREAMLLVRASRWAGVQPHVQQAANEVDPRVIPKLTPMREGMDRRLSNSRSGALTVAFLGMVSLTLAVVGFAGLISFSVTQRTREIGIRLALGASRWEVMRVGLDRLLLPTAIGLATGAAAAAGLADLLRSQLYGLSILDPVSFVGAPVLFLMVALVFSVGPLNRAAKVDPSTALRHD